MNLLFYCEPSSYIIFQIIQTGRVSETDSGVSRPENEGGSSHLAQSENVQEGLPSPASLAGLLSATRQLLNEQVEECLRVCSYKRYFLVKWVSGSVISLSDEILTVARKD